MQNPHRAEIRRVPEEAETKLSVIKEVGRHFGDNKYSPVLRPLPSPRPAGLGVGDTDTGDPRARRGAAPARPGPAPRSPPLPPVLPALQAAAGRSWRGFGVCVPPPPPGPARPHGAGSRLPPPAAPLRGGGPRLAAPLAYGAARQADIASLIGGRRGRRGGRGGPSAPAGSGGGEGSARPPPPVSGSCSGRPAGARRGPAAGCPGCPGRGARWKEEEEEEGWPAHGRGRGRPLPPPERFPLLGTPLHVPRRGAAGRRERELSVSVLSNAVTPPSVSQGACVHLQRPLAAPHTPASGPVSSTTLPMTSDAPVLADWHISPSLISWKAFLP
ncbi:translation initiation factor IF-2-like [Strigops habroptila]|uniref:translation initiation factor IF-2-like n=1 Tax=Strigops habroptila TaxID=2489341 RepID=UPI0011CF9C85|nr:translation initiation factor IF-2-like [Strigops habroptila]